MTPDWSARAAGIPYATLTNPQSLNLYSYVLDNPVTRLDPDGHAGLHAGDEPYAGFGDEERGMYEAAFDPGAASALDEIFTQTQLDAANQAQNQTPFNPTVTYDENLSAKNVAADQSKVGGAVGIINSNWSKLSDQEKATIGNIKSIDVSGSAQRS